MNTAEGTTLAFAADRYEVHLAHDGRSALAVYAQDIWDHEEQHGRLLALLEGMGFTVIGEQGSITVTASEDGLTGALDWDLTIA